MKDLLFDKPKSLTQLKADVGKECKVDGCCNPLTQMQGPGSGALCREHQLSQVEYGGTGRTDRIHTFHRKWVCDCCGKDVQAEVTKKYPNLQQSNPDLFNRLCRNRLIGDHIIRKADGGTDTQENIQTLCLDCNADKTIINEDYRPGKSIE